MIAAKNAARKATGRMDFAQKQAIILRRMFVPRGAIAAATMAVIASIASITIDVARAHEPDAEEIALGSLVDAELAFARMALEQGIRTAFLVNLASDGVVFEPAPMRIQVAWPKRPAPADPKALGLEWQPAQAGVARSYDMGFTTGPSKLTDARRLAWRLAYNIANS